MSKIFDAYRKQLGDSPDLVVDVGRAGSIALFPSPAGPQRDDFNRLANRLLGQRSQKRGFVVSLASSASGEGSSFVSYNTALVLATAFNQKVVWIDANFLAPQGKLMGQEDGTLSLLLQQPEGVHDLVASTNPLLVAGGADLQRHKGLFASQNYAELVMHLSSRFDFVFMDLPPTLETTDSALIAAGTDGFLLVIEQKFLKREVIQSGVNLLKDKGVPIMGTVINRRSFELPKVIYERL